MTLIMLAIGGIMALVGVYAMASGFPVIEVERGWTMVIAGSVLLSGGLVVAALGIVVRTIGRLGLRTAEVSSAVSAMPVAPAMPLSPGDGMPSLGAAVPAAVLAAGYGVAHAQEPALHQQEPHEPKPYEPEPHEASSDDMHHEPELDPEPADHDWHEQPFSAFDLEGAPSPPATAPHAPDPLPSEPDFAEPAAPVPLPAAAPDPDVASMHEAHAPVPEEPVASSPEPPQAETLHEPDPVAEELPDAPSTAPEVPPSNLSVIGRYDSDGTSYVMYSDGSIEAQSEAGVFRFGSMAELKAFIEE